MSGETKPCTVSTGLNSRASRAVGAADDEAAALASLLLRCCCCRCCCGRAAAAVHASWCPLALLHSLLLAVAAPAKALAAGRGRAAARGGRAPLQQHRKAGAGQHASARLSTHSTALRERQSPTLPAAARLGGAHDSGSHLQAGTRGFSASMVLSRRMRNNARRVQRTWLQAAMVWGGGGCFGHSPRFREALKVVDKQQRHCRSSPITVHAPPCAG